mgnify:CR=1 FL=1
MVLPILARGALIVGKKLARNMAKKKKPKKKKETPAEELMRLLGMGKKPVKKSRGGPAGRLAKRGYGKARK